MNDMQHECYQETIGDSTVYLIVKPSPHDEVFLSIHFRLIYRNTPKDLFILMVQECYYEP